MAISVKSQLMAALESGLKGIEELKMVKRIEKSPIHLDKIPFPSAFFWDEREMVRRNPGGLQDGLAEAELTLLIYVVLRFNAGKPDTINYLMDTIQAKIQNLLVGDPGIWAIAAKVNPITVDKEWPTDVLAALIIRATIYYHHAWVDAFSLTAR